MANIPETEQEPLPQLKEEDWTNAIVLQPLTHPKYKLLTMILETRRHKHSLNTNTETRGHEYCHPQKLIIQ
jgi:hypothetical protein